MMIRCVPTARLNNFFGAFRNPEVRCTTHKKNSVRREQGVMRRECHNHIYFTQLYHPQVPFKSLKSSYSTVATAADSTILKEQTLTAQTVANHEPTAQQSDAPELEIRGKRILWKNKDIISWTNELKGLLNRNDYQKVPPDAIKSTKIGSTLMFSLDLTL